MNGLDVHIVQTLVEKKQCERRDIKMSSAEEQYRNIREEIIKELIPGDVLVFLYSNMAVDEVVIKSINFRNRTITGIITYGKKVTKRKIPFDDFIKYGTLLEKKKGT